MKKNSDTEKNQNQENSFEESLSKLEKIISKMEEGKMPLEDMMKNFEEATRLAEQCTKKLKEIEAKIEILVDKNKNNGSGEWNNFFLEEKINTDNLGS